MTELKCLKTQNRPGLENGTENSDWGEKMVQLGEYIPLITKFPYLSWENPVKIRDPPPMGWFPIILNLKQG